MMVSTPPEPWATPMLSSAGLITPVTVLTVFWSTSVATFLPVRVPCDLSRFIRTSVRRSAG